MRYFCVVAFSIILTLSTFSQNVAWNKSYTPSSYWSSNQYAQYSVHKSIGVDGAGNVYSLNAFVGPVYQQYLAKHSLSGQLLWTLPCTGMGTEKLKSDSLGNTYILGSFADSIKIGNINLYDNSGVFVGYFAKIDANGSCIWAKKMPAHSYTSDLEISSDGELYMLGSTGNSGAVIGPDTVPAGCSFISKIDASGQFLTTKRVCSGVAEHLAKDQNGSYYIAGDISQAISIGKGPNFMYLNGSWPMDVFVAKLDTSFNPLWAKLGDSYDGRLEGLKLDPWGNVFIAGTLGTYLVFDNQTIQTSGRNMFLIKIGSSGNVLWMKYSNNANHNSVTNTGNAVAVDKFGNSFVTGTVSDTTSFDTYTISTNNSPYLIKYDPNGNLLWGLSSPLVAADAGSYFGAGKSLCVYNNAIYVAGYSGNFSKFGFISKVNDVQITSVEKSYKPTTDRKLKIFPNPTHGLFEIEYHLPNDGSTTIMISNEQGEALFTENKFKLKGNHIDHINFNNYPKGIYFIRLVGDSFDESEKFVLE